MSWEKVESARSKRRSKNTDFKIKASKQTNSQILKFLETHKTKPCNKGDMFHDTRLCEWYHPNVDDQRRNPYNTFYSPDDGTCFNKIEKMYHPMVFRTSWCTNGSNCIFGNKCARAHSVSELRDRTKETEVYYDHFQPVCQKQPLASSLDLSKLAKDRTNFSQIAWAGYVERQITPTKRSFKVPEHLWFVIRRSNELFQKIQEAAIEEGLATVDRETSCKLIIRGIDPERIATHIMYILQEQSLYFATRILCYGERVITNLRKLGVHGISKSQNLHIQFLSDERLRLTAVRSKKQAARDLLDNEIAKLEFWIKQEKYDDFHSCGCCFGSFNIDQGIACESGHFYCSSAEDGDQCFSMLVRSQFIHLSTRENYDLICPECSAPYENRAVASKLSDEVFGQYQSAIVDAKVTKKANEMNDEFENRLQSAVAEVLEKYGNAESMLLLEAKKLAKEARNTILNLMCPHCETAYFDFTGCMAIQCGRCKGNFCGYCHQKVGTSRGAHEHVRQCLMNETDNGSYYAKPEQIRDAQKRYRTREIKRFLRKYECKKNLQNAVVIELQKDLNDLGIKQEALFELGNLMN